MFLLETKQAICEKNRSIFHSDLGCALTVYLIFNKRMESIIVKTCFLMVTETISKEEISIRITNLIVPKLSFFS